MLAPLAAVIEARITLRAQVSVSVTPGPAPATRVDAAAMGRERRATRRRRSARSPAEDPPIAWYASWVAARTVRARESGPFPNRFQNEHLIGFDYKHVKKETMEAIAFHSAWAMPVTEGLLLHAFSLEQGDVLSNLHIIALDAIDFGLVVGGKGQIPRWYHWTFKQLMTMFLWGFESGWSRVGADNDPYVWTNAAGDIGEVLLYWRWSFLLRELLLSFLTLRNHDKTSVIVAEAATDKPVTCNADCIEGVCYTFWELGSMLVPAHHREDEPQQVRLRRRRSDRHVLGHRVRRLRRRGGVRLSRRSCSRGRLPESFRAIASATAGSCCATGSMGRTGSRAGSKASARGSKPSPPERARCWASSSRWPRRSAIRRSTRTCSPTATPMAARTAPMRWAPSGSAWPVIPQHRARRTCCHGATT